MSKLTTEQQEIIDELLVSDFDSLKDGEWEMGIDEAGRGPVLGPMVYGACAWPKKYKKKLEKLEFADSKKLLEEDRDSLFRVMEKLKGKALYAETKVVDPEVISNKMLSKDKVSLNQLSFASAIDLIRSFLDKGINVTACFLDTVGPPDSYKSLLKSQFSGSHPALNFTVSEKADSKYKVVSAASIFAKVTRDDRLRNWTFAQTLEPAASGHFGSGYPGDDKTVKWLKENMDDVFGFPDVVRFSWSTTEELLKKSTKYQFHYPNSEGENIMWMLKHPKQPFLQRKILLTDDFKM